MPPLHQYSSRMGFVTPMPGRPGGLGAEPGLNTEGMVSQGVGAVDDCGCGGTCGGCGGSMPDIFQRGPVVGISQDNLQIVRRRG